MDTLNNTIDETDDDALDMELVNADIAAGAKAGRKLISNASKDWSLWSITIRGFRAMRDLCRTKARTSHINSDAYRKEMGAMLQEKKYAVYATLLDGKNGKQIRSSCYKLMDGLDDINTWYAGLPPEDQLRWKHPDSVVKHCPQKYLTIDMRGHNKPPRQLPNRKKRVVDIEVERLKAILIRVLEILAQHDPATAAKFLGLINPADPDDSVVDIGDEAAE